MTEEQTNTNEALFQEEEVVEKSATEAEEISVEVPTEQPQTKEVVDEIDEMLEDIEIGEFSDADSLDVKFKEDEDKERVYEIETAELLKPILKGADGPIPPKQLSEKDPTKLGYETKLKITYKDCNYVSMAGKISWYLSVDQNTGKKVLNPWFPRNVEEDDLQDNFTRTISKLYYRVCKAMNKEVGKVSMKEFETYLNSGIKVKLEQWSSKYQGSLHYRIDIKEIVQ